MTDANLRRLQESLAGQGGQNRRQSAPPGHARTGSHPAPAPAYSTAVHNGHARNNSFPGNGTKQTYDRIVEEKVDNCEVNDDEVDALIPPIPSTFEGINAMTLSEVNAVTEDKALCTSFVENTSGVKTLMELKQSIETANVNIAKSNLKHEEEIDGLCTEVETLKQDMNTKMQQYRKLDVERNAITNPPDLQEAIGELNRAKKDAYNESEELAEEWVEAGGENVGDFVNRFCEVRLLYHVRAAKAERLEMSM